MKTHRRSRAGVLALLILGWASFQIPTARAEVAVEVTPFGGYRLSGNLGDAHYTKINDFVVVDLDLEVGDAWEYGLIVDVGPFKDPKLQLELSYNRERTETTVGNRTTGASVSLFRTDVEYWQVGILYQGPQKPFQPFFTFTAGVIRVTPEGSLEGETRTSAAVGGGLKAFASPRFGVRVQAVLHSTYLPATDDLFTDEQGNTYQLPDAVYFMQASLQLGLIVAF